MITTYNVKLSCASTHSAERLIQKYGQRCKPVPGVPFGDTYAIHQPAAIAAGTSDTLIIGND